MNKDWRNDAINSLSYTSDKNTFW
jgi:uncharacterized membrane protein affecting hemolysin expression